MAASDDGRTVDNSWREVAGCTCSPGDGTGECPNYDRCYDVWYDLNGRRSVRPMPEVAPNA